MRLYRSIKRRRRRRRSWTFFSRTCCLFFCQLFSEAPTYTIPVCVCMCALHRHRHHTHSFTIQYNFSSPPRSIDSFCCYLAQTCGSNCARHIHPRRACTYTNSQNSTCFYVFTSLIWQIHWGHMATCMGNFHPFPVVAKSARLWMCVCKWMCFFFYFCSCKWIYVYAVICLITYEYTKCLWWGALNLLSFWGSLNRAAADATRSNWAGITSRQCRLW